MSLIKQFIRGCWDEVIIMQRYLRDYLSNVGKNSISYSNILYKSVAWRKKVCLKHVEKQNKLRKSTNQPQPPKLQTKHQADLPPTDIDPKTSLFH